MQDPYIETKSKLEICFYYCCTQQMLMRWTSFDYKLYFIIKLQRCKQTESNILPPELLIVSSICLKSQSELSLWEGIYVKFAHKVNCYHWNCLLIYGCECSLLSVRLVFAQMGTAVKPPYETKPLLPLRLLICQRFFVFVQLRFP